MIIFYLKKTSIQFSIYILTLETKNYFFKLSYSPSVTSGSSGITRTNDDNNDLYSKI